jgi:hypothetical protein
LELDAQQFCELVDQGKIDGMPLDRDCVERRMRFDDARAAPPKTRH